MKKKWIEFCKHLPGVYEDYPFDENWAAMRHTGSKCFAFVFDRNGKTYLNVKCEPMRADFLRGMYQGITPAYHMNKVHWNSVDPASDVPEEVIRTLIEESYRVTAPKARKSVVLCQTEETGVLETIFSA